MVPNVEPNASGTPDGEIERVPASRSAVEYTDVDGVQWTVREIAPATTLAHSGQPSLIFESAMAVRRVWRYPSDWRTLSSEHLSALSWGT